MAHWLWLLCLMCVSAPTWGSDGGGPDDAGTSEDEEALEDLEWNHDAYSDEDRTWKEDCAFAPGGQLWRMSGSSSGAMLSGGFESFAFRLGGETVLRFGQEGSMGPGGGNRVPEEDVWKVRCTPGQVDIGSETARVSLRFREQAFSVDAALLQTLQPGSRTRDDAALRALEEMLEGLGESRGLAHVSGLKEATLRVKLLRTELALAVRNLVEARSLLQQVEALGPLPETSSWALNLNTQLEALYSKPPLVAAEVRRVGALLNLPGSLHEEDAPVLFWRGTELCVRQEEAGPPRMRCLQAKTGRWSRVERYRSPFASGWKVKLEHQGAAGLYQTRVSSIGPEGERVEHGEWYSPVVVARAREGKVVVVNESKGELMTDYGEDGGVSGMKDFPFASEPGSLVAGDGRYYFSAPDELRSLEVEGLRWRFVLPAPGGELRCAAAPRVSPNGRWAACPAPAEGKPSRFPLMVFRLAPQGR